MSNGSGSSRAFRPAHAMGLVALLAAVFGLAPSSWAQQASQERLIIMIDRSSSMGLDNRFDRALDAAMSELSVNLRAGVRVCVVLFAERPVDRQGRWFEPTQETATAVAAARAYCNSYRPGMFGRTMTWTTIEQLLQSDVLASRNARLSLYWDGRATDGQRQDRVLRRLAERWELAELRDVQLRIQRWTMASKSASAAVAFNFKGRAELKDLTPAAFAGADRSCSIQIPVRALIAGELRPGQKVELFDATVQPLSAPAMPLQCAAATMEPAALTADNAPGTVNVLLKANSAPQVAAFADRYEVRLRFVFGEGQEQRIIPAPAPLTFQVTSKPTVTLHVPQQELSLYPGETIDVPVQLRGSEDAAGAIATVDVGLRAAGVSAGLLAGKVSTTGPSSATTRPGAQRLAVALPAQSQYTSVICRLRGVVEGRHRVSVVARLGDSAPTADLVVNVAQPALQAAWTYDKPTELPEFKQKDGDWTELLRGPLQLRRLGTSRDGLQAKLSFDSADADVELAFDDGSGRKVSTVVRDVSDARDEKVFARWRRLPKGDEIALPAFHIEPIAGNLPYTVAVRSEVSMSGAIAPGTPSLRVAYVGDDPVDLKVPGTLLRQEATRLSGSEETALVELMWNTAAARLRGAAVRVEVEALPAGAAITIGQASGSTALTPGSPITIPLVSEAPATATPASPSATGDSMSRMVPLSLKLPVMEGPTEVRLRFRLIDEGGKEIAAASQWQLQMPFKLILPVLGIALEQAMKQADVYAGSPSDAAHITVSGQGLSGAVTVRCEMRDSAPRGVKVGCALRQGDAPLKQLAVADGSTRSATVALVPELGDDVDTEQLRQPVQARIVVKGDNGAPLRFGQQVVQEVSFPIELRFPRGTLLAIWGTGDDQVQIDSLPPATGEVFDFAVNKDGQMHRTSLYDPPMRLGVFGTGVVTDAMKAARVRVRVADGAGVVGEKVSFEVVSKNDPDQPEPADEVTVGELLDPKGPVRGLIFQSKLMQTPQWLDASVHRAEVVIEPVDARKFLLDPAVLGLNVTLKPKLPLWPFLLAVVVAALGVLIGVRVRSRRSAKTGTKAGSTPPSAEQIARDLQLSASLSEGSDVGEFGAGDVRPPEASAAASASTAPSDSAPTTPSAQTERSAWDV